MMDLTTIRGKFIDEFKADAPVNNKTATTEATNKVEVAEVKNANTNDLGETGVTYTTTVPYFIEADNGDIYQFAGYDTTNKYFGNSKEKGKVTLDQSNIVATYVLVHDKVEEENTGKAARTIQY